MDQFLGAKSTRMRRTRQMEHACYMGRHLHGRYVMVYTLAIERREPEFPLVSLAIECGESLAWMSPGLMTTHPLEVRKVAAVVNVKDWFYIF